MNSPNEIFEDVLSISYAMGGEMDPDTQVIMTVVAQSYKTKYPKADIMQAKWEDFKIEAKVDIMPRAEEPYRVKKYIKNHRIMNEEWERKKREQLDELTQDQDLTLYKVSNPAQNLFFEKQAEQSSFDPNAFAVYKVSMEIRSDFSSMNVRKTRHTSFVCTIKEKYVMTFQELNIETFDPTCLSEFFIYLLVTPVTVFMWLGAEIDEEIRNGCLSIIKAFF